MSKKILFGKMIVLLLYFYLMLIFTFFMNLWRKKCLVSVKEQLSLTSNVGVTVLEDRSRLITWRPYRNNIWTAFRKTLRTYISVSIVNVGVMAIGKTIQNHNVSSCAFYDICRRNGRYWSIRSQRDRIVGKRRMKGLMEWLTRWM